MTVHGLGKELQLRKRDSCNGLKSFHSTKPNDLAANVRQLFVILCGDVQRWLVKKVAISVEKISRIQIFFGLLYQIKKHTHTCISEVRQKYNACGAQVLRIIGLLHDPEKKPKSPKYGLYVPPFHASC